MIKSFHTLVQPTSFQINKGNIRLVCEAADYSIKYPTIMEGHINITQVGGKININLLRDFAPENPVTINLNNLKDCNINLENGTLRSECTSSNMKVKLSNGTLSARVSKYQMASITAHVSTGVLNNSSNLTKKPQDTNHYFEMFEELNSSSSMGFIKNIWTGLDNHIELIGEGSNHATFEVGAGVINLDS